MVRESDLVEVTSVVSVCRDPKGDEFLELTLSGDYDLLSLHPFRGIAILSPQDFVTERESPVYPASDGGSLVVALAIWPNVRAAVVTLPPFSLVA